MPSPKWACLPGKAGGQPQGLPCQPQPNSLSLATNQPMVALTLMPRTCLGSIPAAFVRASTCYTWRAALSSSSAAPVAANESSSSSLPRSSGTTALIFDTETTGRVDFNLPPSHPSQPDLVQLGMLLVDTETWQTRSQVSMLVQSRPGVTIEPGAEETHGISSEDCRRYGVHPDVAVSLFLDLYERADIIVAHNLTFDAAVMEAALGRTRALMKGRSENYFDTKVSIGLPGDSMQRVCTMKASIDLLKLPSKFGSGYKWPSLAEAFQYVHDEELEGGHDALVDAKACLDVFRHLVENETIDLRQPTSKSDTSNSREGRQVDAKSTNFSDYADEEAETTSHQFNPSPEGVLVQRTSRGFVVSGNTYWIRAALKEHGGRWDYVRKQWRFSGMTALPAIEELTGMSLR